MYFIALGVWPNKLGSRLFVIFEIFLKIKEYHRPILQKFYQQKQKNDF